MEESLGITLAEVGRPSVNPIDDGATLITQLSEGGIAAQTDRA